MVDKICELLMRNTEISDWKINYVETEGDELFFIRKNLDMHRAKKVSHLYVTVYKDSIKDDIKVRGESTSEIHPSMNESDIQKIISDTLFAASLSKNKYYPIVDKCEKAVVQKIYKLDEKPLEKWLGVMADELFENDNYENGYINSSELFLYKNNRRIINSKGIDINYYDYSAQLEFIVTWKENSEEIEVYKDLLFADYCEGFIADRVNEVLELAKDKAKAQATPKLLDIPVILTGGPVKEIFNYFYENSNAQMVYEEASSLKLGDSPYTGEGRGTKINITLDPSLDNSTESASYDSDGHLLEKINIFKDGKLINYWGDNRYSCYLGIKSTGSIGNIVVHEGNLSIDEFKNEPYLEIKEFSDFQADTFTGDFAGEIRLGWYFDGSIVIPVSGGSISGNIKDIGKDMILSKEIYQDNSFRGPKSIKLPNVAIAGV